MRKFTLTSALLIAVILPSAVQAQASNDRAAVQAVVTALADAVHQNALSSADQLFAPTGVHVLAGNAALHGWGEYRTEVLEPEMARYGSLRYAHTGIETSVRGNIAWTAFRWQMSSAGDGPAPALGRASAVLEKIDGSWKIAHLHFSR